MWGYLSLLPAFLALWAITGVWTVFALAVANRSVNLTEGFPYISLCGSYPPQSCIFSQLLNMGAAMAAWICIIRYHQLRDWGVGRWFNQVILWTGLLCALGTSVVGNFQVRRRALQEPSRAFGPARVWDYSSQHPPGPPPSLLAGWGWAPPRTAFWDSLSFFKDFIYLFMREGVGAERGRDRGRGRSRLHAGSRMQDSIMGLRDHALSRRQTDANRRALSHPGVPYLLGLLFLLWLLGRGEAKEPAARTSDRGLLCLIRGQPVLLAAALSLLVDEEPAPTWGPLDQATPPGPLQPLHHPHGGHGHPPPLAAALGLRCLRVGHRHAAVHALRPVCGGFFLPGRLHPVSPAGPQPQPPTGLPHLPAGPPVNGSPIGVVWRQCCDQGHLGSERPRPANHPCSRLFIIIIINFFVFVLFCRRRNQRHGRRQGHAKPEFLPESKSVQKVLKGGESWGRGGAWEGGVGDTRTDGPLRPDLLSHPNQPPSLPPPHREIDQ
ncbi:modulator of macroautophagy TMEM150B isoform X2 [Canis lupus baileyi]